MDPTPPPAEPTPPAQYEFTAEQNKVIGEMASSMIWVAAPFIGIGILYLIGGVLNIIKVGVAVANGEHKADALVNAGFILLGGAAFVFVGKRLRLAADRFQAIVNTSGRDISNLMDGIASLGRLFAALAFLVRIYIFLVLALLIVFVVTAVVEWLRRGGE